MGASHITESPTTDNRSAVGLGTIPVETIRLSPFQMFAVEIGRAAQLYGFVVTEDASMPPGKILVRGALSTSLIFRKRASISSAVRRSPAPAKSRSR